MVDSDHAQSSGEEPIDVKALLGRCLNDASFVAATLDSFVSTVPKHIEELITALQQADSETAVREAHSIKGAAGMITAESVRAIAAEIEALGTVDQLQDAIDRLDDLRAEFEVCSDYIAMSEFAARP